MKIVRLSSLNFMCIKLHKLSRKDFGEFSLLLLHLPQALLAIFQERLVEPAASYFPNLHPCQFETAFLTMTSRSSSIVSPIMKCHLPISVSKSSSFHSTARRKSHRRHLSTKMEYTSCSIPPKETLLLSLLLCLR